MIFCNEAPTGEIIDGKVAVIQLRANEDRSGHPAAFTPHALLALNKLTARLLRELSEQSGAEIVGLKRQHLG